MQGPATGNFGTRYREDWSLNLSMQGWVETLEDPEAPVLEGRPRWSITGPKSWHTGLELRDWSCTSHLAHGAKILSTTAIEDVSNVDQVIPWIKLASGETALCGSSIILIFRCIMLA